MLFREQVYTLATQALESLSESQAKGKVPNNPLSENHFFSVWVSKSLKEKNFSVLMGPLLKHWQQCARTQGAGANLKGEFQAIKNTYQALDELGHVITKQKVDTLIETLTTSDWQVNLEDVINKKHSIKKEKNSSFAIDKSKLMNAFDDDSTLKTALSVFVRGDQQAFINAAHQIGILVFKVTDYKSIVKFHGEFIIAPQNNSNAVAEFISVEQ